MNNPVTHRVAAVIPCFKVRAHILPLVAGIGPEVDAIICVDDACPEGSGDFIRDNCNDPRLRVITHAENQGVGGAVLTGFRDALQQGCDIAVKLDGDGQMDPRLLPQFVEPIAHSRADYTKGNRFFSPQSLADMPRGRLLGNAVLSFVSKFSTGYWDVFDPTNGYLAIDLRLLPFMETQKIARRYFFETDMLFRLNLLSARVVDIPMRAIYADEVSNLSFSKEASRFARGHSKNFLKRIWYNYFLRNFSVASLELVVGTALLLSGIVYALLNYGGAEPASPGTVTVASMLFLVGILLLLSFLNFDIRRTPSTPIASLLPKATQEHDAFELAETGGVGTSGADPNSVPAGAGPDANPITT